MSIMTDPAAPPRPADPHTPLETALMRAALHDKTPDYCGADELPLLIPDDPARMPCNSPITPEIRAAVQRITGREVTNGNAPHARALLKRWAVSWIHYMAS